MSEDGEQFSEVFESLKRKAVDIMGGKPTPKAILPILYKVRSDLNELIEKLEGATGKKLGEFGEPLDYPEDHTE